MMSGVKESPMEVVVGEGKRSRSGASDVARRAAGRALERATQEEVVLRLLRGERLEALAGETGQAAGTLSAWREDFRFVACR